MRGLRWNKEMEKFKISQIEIMNFWKRKQEGQYMKKLIEISAKPLGIPVYLSYDDGALGFFKNYKKALTEHEECDGTHRLVIHDDMTFDRNVLDKIIYIMQRAPQDAFVSFFNPTNKLYEECDRNVLRTQSNFWIPCAVYPNEFIRKMIDTLETVSKEQYKDGVGDAQVAAYLQYTGQYAYAVVPGIVQHLGAYRSTLNIPGEIAGVPRNSCRYDNQLKVENIDWEKEFKYPYEDNRTKDWTKKFLQEEYSNEYCNRKKNGRQCRNRARGNKV